MEYKDEKRIDLITTTECSVETAHSESGQPLLLHPHSWPTEPEKLKKPLSACLPSIALDVVLITFPVALICKVGLCILAARRDVEAVGFLVDQVSDLTVYLIRFNDQLVTLFTIVFATIVSTLVRRTALWRAQRGASVAELEQWQASISVTSTIKTIFSLRMYTCTSLGLVILWSWYYLGSQASSREYGYRDAGPYFDIPITVTNTRGPTYLDESYFGNITNSQMSAANAYFAHVYGAVSFPDPGSLRTGFDGEGLPRIPYIDQVVGNADKDGFWQVDVPSNVSYVSEIGVQPYIQFSDQFNLWPNGLMGDLSFDTSYIDVTCGPMRVRNLSDFPAGVLPQMAFTVNVSSVSDATTNVTGKIEGWWRVNDTRAEIQAMSCTCALKNVALSVKATCASQGCIVKKLRPITTANSSVVYQTLFDNATYARRFFDNLLLSTGVPLNYDDAVAAGTLTYPTRRRMPLLYNNGSQRLLMTELELLATLQPKNLAAFADKYHQTPAEVEDAINSRLLTAASERSTEYMTQWINGFIAIYQQRSFAYDTLQAQVDKDPDAFLALVNGSQSTPWLNPATFKGSYYLPHYALTLPWIVIDFISCVVLLVSGLVAVYLRQVTFAPDIFGYVSSLTRDNPHVNLMTSASTLVGFERARALKDIKLKIADLQPNSEIGRIGVVSYSTHCDRSNSSSPGGERIGDLSKERFYV